MGAAHAVRTHAWYPLWASGAHHTTYRELNTPKSGLWRPLAARTVAARKAAPAGPEAAAAAAAALAGSPVMRGVALQRLVDVSGADEVPVAVQSA